MTTAIPRSIALLAALALGAGACSSTPASTHAGAGSTASVPTTTSTTAAPSAQDQSTANTVVLHAADLPGSWNAGPAQPNTTAGDAQVSHCLGIPDTDPDETAYASSPEFTQNAIQIASQTTVYNSVTAVQGDLRGRLSPNVASCISELLAAQIPGVSHVLLHLTALPATAGSLQGFRLTGTFQVIQSGSVVTASFDEVALAKNRIEVSLIIVTKNAAVPSGLMDTATAAVAPRLEATA